MHFTQIRLLCERDLIRFEQTNLELWSMIELKSFATHQICRFAFQAAGRLLAWLAKVTSFAAKSVISILAHTLKWKFWTRKAINDFKNAARLEKLWALFALYIRFFHRLFTKLVMVGRHIFTEFNSFAHQFYHHRLLFSLTICFFNVCV